MRFLALVFLATPALASTDEAWETFRAEVQAACQALAEPLGTAVVEVNAFGSAKFGAALVTVAAEGAVERRVCIFDKQTKAAELTEPFAQ